MKRTCIIFAMVAFLFACNQKSEINDLQSGTSTKSQSKYQSENAPMSGVVDMASVHRKMNKVTNTNGDSIWTYAELVAQLLSSGANQVPQPIGWIPQAGLNAYDSVYFWHLEDGDADDMIIIYRFLNPDDVPLEPTESGCDRKWYSGPTRPGEIPCYDNGNQCRLDIKTGTVICC